MSHVHKRKKKPKSGKFSVLNNLPKSGIFEPKASRSPKKKSIYIVNQPRVGNVNDSEEDEGLIDLKKLLQSHAPAVGELLDQEKLDKIIQQEHLKPIPTPSPNQQSFASNLLGTNDDILANYQKIQQPKIALLKEKFASLNIPSPTNSKKELKTRVLSHKSIIPHILNGTTASHYYNLAKQQYKSSNNSSMTKADNWQINWASFIGGYYGLKRQQFVALILLSEFKSLIQNIKNATVSYWNYHQFTTYVLANEIIIRLVMKDMHCSQIKAENIILETHEYGQFITDTIPLIDDLELGEQLFAQESNALMLEIEKLQPIEVSLSKDVLDDLLSDSESN